MIAIKDMEMPENCSDCDLCHGHICKITGTDIVTNPKGNCLLVEIVTCKDFKHWHDNDDWVFEKGSPCETCPLNRL